MKSFRRSRRAKQPNSRSVMCFRLNQIQVMICLAGRDSNRPRFVNYKVRAQIDRQSLGDEGLLADQLLEDSTALYAARVKDGISVLLVDGDPSASSERSETHYLRSLDVEGTGLETEVVTVSELETVSLSEYEIIFLCNVDEASPDRVKTIEQWVKDGGALVFMPGQPRSCFDF